MSNYQILQGNCIDVLKTLPAGSARTCVTSPLSEIFPLGVRFAMNKIMAIVAESNDVGNIESKFRITSPRLDVVSMEPAQYSFWRSAADAMVIIPLVYPSLNLFPFTAGVKLLTFRGATVFVIWISLAICAIHAVTRSAQPGFRNAGFFRQNLFGLIAVFLSQKSIGYSLLCPVVFAFQIQTTRAGWYSKLNQFFVNALRVAAYKFADFISGQTFNDVLLMEPVFIKVRRFIHNSILPRSMAVVNV